MKDKKDKNVIIGENVNEIDSPVLFKNRIWRVNDVADYLSVSKGHIYNLTSKTRIPHRKTGKLLYFLPSEIIDWVDSGGIF